ncbi:hypothetical protein [Microbacterium sp.]|uniref:hypothetical protein n=1 Tax=Microbacterium sp. TaxID=51671 RepID=UPI00273766D6|nr:hypothetical protein [Microbacterium sp.]MDP3953163.1 hypothetical protein [Microbacterium sp.]
MSHSTERDGRADSEVPRSAPPRAELDADIKELRAALGLEPPVDDWPFAAPRFSEGPRRRLTEVARLLLPDHAAETLEREWRTTGWWWMPGIDNEWECSFASDRFAAGVWGPGLRAAVSRTRKSASVQFPPSAGERLDRWSSISPMHAAHVTMLELLEADPQWWDTVRHGDYVVAADDWVSRLQDSLSGLPGDERRSAPRGGSDGSNLLDYAAAGLVQLGGLALTDAATADAVRQCVICDTPYRVRALSAHEVYTVGSTQYCPLCCADVVQGVLHDQGAMDPWANTAIWAIRTVSAHDFSGPPSREQVAAPLRGPRERHLLQVLTRMLIPRDAEAVFQPSRKQRSWTEWLALAEVLGEGQRQSRGTWITATDGHLCRSMFERHIDDFMTHYDIAHNPEPQYPYDAGLNPAGLRADWQLADGTFVEALGLTGTSEYDQKVERKKALASRFNVPLLLITPADLGRLPHLFAPWLV